VTSGGFGPSAGFPVAMGYVGKAFAPIGSQLFADIRGNRIALHVQALPFIPHRYHKG
jgi:aminomethyltransferase